MLHSGPSSLWLRLATPLLLFVVIGSTGIALWLHSATRRESQSVFATLARTNADFIRNAKLPANERVAESISRVLTMEVLFRQPPLTSPSPSFIPFIPTPSPSLHQYTPLLSKISADDGIVRLGSDFEAIVVPLDWGLQMIFLRKVKPVLGFLLKPDTILILSSFWLFSIGLAWALARGLVQPLRQLALRLPHIEDDHEASLPGSERRDEIGQVARAYLETRAQLRAERDQRARSERLALLGRMATGLAHEIHNPLSAIQMHAQIIGSSTPSEQTTTLNHSLPILLGETAKIESLVNQWMFLARPAPPQTAPADLADVCASVVHALTPQAHHARVQIITEVPQNLHADVDRRRLAQAIGNVIINAIQAMPTGGTLTISGWRGDSLRLVFRDTGQGFSLQALANHTELFFSEKEGGMGIGLSVTAEVLKAHNGALLVANAPTGGAGVTLQLPALLEKIPPNSNLVSPQTPNKSSHQ